MINIRRLIATGQILGWGQSPFDTPPGEGEEDITASGAPDEQTRLGKPQHCKVVGGVVVDMTQTEKDAVDAEAEVEAERRGDGAVDVRRTYPNVGRLPKPPPRSGLLVGLRTVPGGDFGGLAFSTATKWKILRFDGEV